MHETGHSTLVHWDNPEGWDGREVGGGSRMGGHKYTHDRFMSTYGKSTQYCKVINLQLKLINYFFKRYISI